jgi:hypothetical protein
MLCAAGMSLDELQTLKNQLVRLRDQLNDAAG